MGKNSFKKPLVMWPLLLTAIFVLLYVRVGAFAVVVNGLCEMLYTGGSRGLMMYYHDAGMDYGLTAIGASLLTVLIPAIKPQYLWMANVGYYGDAKGFVLTAVGVMIALIFLFSWGRLLAYLAKRLVSKSPKWLQMAWVIMSLCVSSLYWAGWIAFALGLWNPLDQKREP